MEPVRLGIIGCGVIGRRHAMVAAESPLITLAAVADVREAAAHEVAEQYSAQHAYESAETLLHDPEIEAVVLALPLANRTELALKALSAGKHTLIEKPIARNAAEVRELIAAKNDLVVACCSSRMRGLASAQAATEFIASGRLGNLRIVRCRAVKGAGAPPTTPPPAWRLSKAMNGGGILMNWGCYDLDYLLGITCWSLRPHTVLAQTWDVSETFQAYAAPGSDAEAHVAALIVCQGGTVISFERGEFAAMATDEAWQVLGDCGSLRLQMTPSASKRIVFDEATSQGVVSQIIWQGDEAWGQEHVAVLEDFALAVRTGREPRTTLEHALLVQQISDAIYASAHAGAAAMLA